MNELIQTGENSNCGIYSQGSHPHTKVFESQPTETFVSPPENFFRAQYPSICSISLEVRKYLAGLNSNILYCVANLTQM